jgi:hypothetical protein
MPGFLTRAKERWDELRHGNERYFQRWEAVGAEVKNMSLAEAETVATAYLAKPNLFTPSRPLFPHLSPLESQLSPQLREFFERYPAMDFCSYGTSWDRSQIEKSERLPDYLCIGRADDHSELLVRPSCEEVGILSNEWDADEGVDESYASIYHFIVYKCRVNEID